MFLRLNKLWQISSIGGFRLDIDRPDRSRDVTEYEHVIQIEENELQRDTNTIQYYRGDGGDGGCSTRLSC